MLLSVGPTVAARTADFPTNADYHFVFLPKGPSVMWMKIAMTLNSLVCPHSLAHRKGSLTEFLSLVSWNHISAEQLFLSKSNSSELNLHATFLYCFCEWNEIKWLNISNQLKSKAESCTLKMYCMFKWVIKNKVICVMSPLAAGFGLAEFLGFVSIYSISWWRQVWRWYRKKNVFFLSPLLRSNLSSKCINSLYWWGN